MLNDKSSLLHEIGPCGRSCTRTVSVLSGVSLLLDYAGVMKFGASGRSFARNLRVRSAALYTLSYRSMEDLGGRMAHSFQTRADGAAGAEENGG